MPKSTSFRQSWSIVVAGISLALSMAVAADAQCRWVSVDRGGRIGLNSHQPGDPWCDEDRDEFLAGLDLDSARNFSAHDSPVIGRACCKRGQQWRGTYWVPVYRDGINSHRRNNWCDAGSFLVSIDLDGPRNFSAHDSPVVGQAQCARTRRESYDDCRWVRVDDSHRSNEWCEDDWFLVSFDLDGPRNYSAYDAPIVGQAQCCRPGD